jgi:hypothetical protein
MANVLRHRALRYGNVSQHVRRSSFFRPQRERQSRIHSELLSWTNQTRGDEKLEEHMRPSFGADT